MSLRDKYTWAMFKAANPSFKNKRTSDEGKKLFEQAFKDFTSKLLKDRADRYGKLKAKTDKKLGEKQALLKKINKKTPGTKVRQMNKIATAVKSLSRAAKRQDDVSKRAKQG